MDATPGFAFSFRYAKHLPSAGSPHPDTAVAAAFGARASFSLGLGDSALVLGSPVTCPARHLFMILRSCGSDESQHDRDSSTEKCIAIDTQSVAQPQDGLTLPRFQARDPRLDCHLARRRKLTNTHDDELADVFAGTSANSRVKKTNVDGFPRLVSKSEMIEMAWEAGLGKDLNLDRVFVDWQSIGLLGRPDTRAPRRGGEGLWHPNQLYLWLNLLHFRTRLKRRVPTLANLPVAAWRLSEEGVATEQAQRAYGLWDSLLDNTQRPKGDRSLRRQAIDERIEWLAAADAPRTAKLRLRDLIERINDTAPKITVSPDTLAGAVLGVLAPGRDPTDIEKMIARSHYDSINFQTLAHRHRDHLLATTSATLEFWEWARRLDQIEMQQELALRPRLAQNPDVGRFYQAFTADEFTTGSCMRMQTIFGIGLRRLLDTSTYWPEGSEEPPPLPRLTKTSG